VQGDGEGYRGEYRVDIYKGAQISLPGFCYVLFFFVKYIRAHTVKQFTAIVSLIVRLTLLFTGIKIT
jgi:hypothetical protein